MTVERGSLLNNRYQIIEILGQGGMGSIYRAIDENLGVDVAVKENLFTTEEYARQFRREAVILASLRHPNLPRVTDHFVIEGQGQYLVMDFIEGEDLRERIDRDGLLSDADVVILGTKICDALTYLHTRHPQVVHRDIKPGNVKITPSGNIILVDFGLAKVFAGGQTTTTGARAMTPGYSPPEQYGTASTDHRSDIYSLGATLYMALSGALPEDALARAMGQTELTPVRRYNPRTSRRLTAVLEKAMALRPEDRYQSAEEFKQALIKSRAVTGKRGVIERTLPPAPGMLRAGANNVAALELAPPSDQNSGEDSPAASQMRNSILPPPIEAKSGHYQPPGRVQQRRFGCWLIGFMILGVVAVGAFGVYRYQPSLYQQAIVWGEDFAARVPIPIIAFLPSPTETGTSPTTAVGGEITVTPAEPSPTSMVIGTAAIITSPTTTPRPTRTVSPTPTATALGGGAGQIAYASDITGLPQIWLMNADGTAQHQLSDMPQGACQPNWAPDGTRIAFISPCASNQEIYPGSAIFIINHDGSELTLLPSSPGGDFDPAWSPDGTKIAFTSLRDFNRAQIYVYNFEDDTVKSLSANTVRDSQPAWSPDGRQIAFVTTRRGPSQIWIMDSEGGGAFLLSRSGSAKDSHPIWSPSGDLVLYTQNEVLGGVPRLVSMELDASDLVEDRLIRQVIPMREASFSPDGNWIAFESWPEGNDHDIYIMTFFGSVSQRLENELLEEIVFEFDPSWRP
jgi:serine/threonine protein kinase/Tol biopolymer transport system component